VILDLADGRYMVHGGPHRLRICATKEQAEAVNRRWFPMKNPLAVAQGRLGALVGESHAGATAGAPAPGGSLADGQGWAVAGSEGSAEWAGPGPAEVAEVRMRGDDLVPGEEVAAPVPEGRRRERKWLKRNGHLSPRRKRGC
jgi:hypothetical protein